MTEEKQFPDVLYVTREDQRGGETYYYAASDFDNGNAGEVVATYILSRQDVLAVTRTLGTPEVET